MNKMDLFLFVKNLFLFVKKDIDVHVHVFKFWDKLL